MTNYDKLYTKFSGLSLIVAPLILLFATFVKAAGIGSKTGRWYDGWIESIVLFLGFSLMIVAILTLSRIVGQRHAKLGLTSAIFGLVGTCAALFPIAVRYIGANALASGITTEQLDPVFGGTEVAPPAESHAIGLFIMFFFLGFILLAIGLWRIKEVPRTTPLFLVAGVVLFMVAQTPFEVILVAYIASTLSWLLAMAPIGWRILNGSPNFHTSQLEVNPIVS